MCKDANVDVYIAIIPENGCMEAVYPPERDQEINLTSNEKIKKEKHYVWRLLEYAVLNSFGFCMEDMAFQKTKRGKWITPNCEFSLSHSNGVVAVAVSRFRVGIDIEIAHGACSPRIAPRVLTEMELLEYNSLADIEREEYLIKKVSFPSLLLSPVTQFPPQRQCIF